MKHYGDICKIDGAAVEPVDVICGGSPCQDLSLAGKRAGLAGARSGLFMEQIRLIKEMRKNDELHCGRTGESVRPRFMVWETVPGAFSSNKGDDFLAVLEETVKIKDSTVSIPRPADGRWPHAGCIVGDGFSVAWREHDAQYWGVPQRRKRISLVADFGGQCAAEILFESESVSGNSEPCEQAREEAPGSVGNGAYPTVARSLTQRYDGSPCIDRGPNFVMQKTADAVFADMYNGAIDGDISATLNAASGSSPTHSGPSVVFGVTTKGNGEAFLSEERHTSLGCGGGQAGQGYPCAFVSNDPTVLKRRFSNVEALDGKVSPTLEAGCGEGGNNVPMVMDEALSFQERAGKPGGGKGILIQHDKVASLRTNQNQAVCMETFHCSSTEECSETLKARDYKDPHVVAYGISSLDSNAMKSANPNSGIYEAESTRTLDNNGGNPACNQGGMMVVQTYRKQAHPMNAEQGQGWEQTDTADTLNVYDNTEARTPVAVVEDCVYDARGNGSGKISPTLTGDHQNRVTDYTAVMAANIRNFCEDKVNGALQANAYHNNNSNNTVRQGTIVRRLTPGECTALQGFPAGWVDIGDWVDTKGKKHKESDSCKYKALGNSIAIPYWAWMAKRMAMFLPKGATMASLFDGIGGFPLSFSRAGVKPVWASEIEEFPIAVTKIRFPEV